MKGGIIALLLFMSLVEALRTTSNEYFILILDFTASEVLA
jgi:hypothetical protein